MRTSVVVSTVALAAVAVAAWLYGDLMMPKRIPGNARPANEPGRRPDSLGPLKRAELAPQKLEDLAGWLRDLPINQRGQYVRSRIGALSVDSAEDRAAIATFLGSGADVEVENPGDAGYVPEAGRTTLRRLLLEMLERFPREEAMAVATANLKAKDFRDTYLCMRVMERFNPGGNAEAFREATAAALRKALHPVRVSTESERMLGEFDRIAEPMAQYRLADLHPIALEVVNANPVLAGRYTQAIESFPTEARAAIYAELFSRVQVARELVNATATRSANIWKDSGFRAQVTKFFAERMSDSQRLALITSLSEESGLHYPDSPLAPVDDSILVPTAPEADRERAEARLAMLRELEPHAQKPEMREGLGRSRDAIAAEIEAMKDLTPASPVRLPGGAALEEPASVGK